MTVNTIVLGIVRITITIRILVIRIKKVKIEAIMTTITTIRLAILTDNTVIITRIIFPKNNHNNNHHNNSNGRHNGSKHSSTVNSNVCDTNTSYCGEYDDCYCYCYCDRVFIVVNVVNMFL